jgi:hypothetical protein
MYTKGRKAPKKSGSGSVQMRVSNGRLQLVFTHGGKRHFLSLGVSDNPFNRMKAQEKVFELQRDIEYGRFDETYAKYKIQSALVPSEPEHSVPQLTLTDLWGKYMDYKSPNASPKTIDSACASSLQPLQYRRIERSPEVTDGVAAGDNTITSEAEPDTAFCGLQMGYETWAGGC